MKFRGNKQWKNRIGTARKSILGCSLPAANTELRCPLSNPDFNRLFPVPRVVAIEPDRLGRPRFRFDGERATVRITLPHRFNPHTLLVDGRFQPIADDDCLVVEVLVPRRPGARQELADLGGPLWDTQWLRPDEYAAALSLCRELQIGVAYAGVTLSRNPHPVWITLELPYPQKPNREIVVNLPLSDGPWGKAETAGFLFVVVADATRRRVPLDPDVCLGKAVPHTLVEENAKAQS